MGPGIAVAATGVGAADLVATSVAGSRYGNVLIWAVVVGALLKYVLNEGVARWQLATGTTVFEGWARHLGSVVRWYFLAYLVIWPIFVSGGVMVTCGLAAHTFFPQLSIPAWGIIHSIICFLVVLRGSYITFERIIKVIIVVMFVSIIGAAIVAGIGWKAIVVPQMLPADDLRMVLSLIGGVGGSVTMLCYGYWIREKQWRGGDYLPLVRIDLATAYVLTGLFGGALMVLSTHVLLSTGVEVAGSGALVQLGNLLTGVMGETGRLVFLIGFWGVVLSSLLGVFQGVPYLFADYVWNLRGAKPEERERMVGNKSLSYRVFLGYLAFPCMLMLYIDNPIWIVITYAAVSALFVPFFAATLLYMNSRVDWVGEKFRNGWVTNLVLVATLALFGYLGVVGFLARLS